MSAETSNAVRFHVSIDVPHRITEAKIAEAEALVRTRIRYALGERMIAQQEEIRQRANLIREQIKWWADRGMAVLVEDFDGRER